MNLLDQWNSQERSVEVCRSLGGNRHHKLRWVQTRSRVLKQPLSEDCLVIFKVPKPLRASDCNCSSWSRVIEITSVFCLHSYEILGTVKSKIHLSSQLFCGAGTNPGFQFLSTRVVFFLIFSCPGMLHLQALHHAYILDFTLLA